MRKLSDETDAERVRREILSQPNGTIEVEANAVQAENFQRHIQRQGKGLQKRPIFYGSNGEPVQYVLSWGH